MDLQDKHNDLFILSDLSGILQITTYLQKYIFYKNYVELMCTQHITKNNLICVNNS